MTASLGNTSNPPWAVGVDPYVNPPLINALRAPTSLDVYQAGTEWCDRSVNPRVLYITSGSGVWQSLAGGGGSFTNLTANGTISLNTVGAGTTSIGTGGTGAVNIGNTTGGTAVTGSMTTGALTVVGAANINTSGAAASAIGTGGTGAVTIGNATGGTAFTGTTTLAAMTQVGTASINASGAAATTIGTGGTGAVNIGNATGNTAVTGSLTASGNVIVNGAGTQLRVHGGAVTDFIGAATLVSGTVTVANTNIAATDKIFIQRNAANASTTLGELTYTISAGASFTITSLIFGTPASPQTADLSTVDYFIVRQV